MNDKERVTKNIRTAVAMYHSVSLVHAAFEKGMGGTKEEQQQATTFVLSLNILGAFGIENALKALIRREGKNPKNIHNLRKLYEILAPETQQRIHEKSKAIEVRVNGKGMRIRIEGVIDEHQDSFQEWRYRGAGKDLLVVLGVLTGTLLAMIRTHDEKYGADLKREEKQGADRVSPAMHETAMKYYKNVLMPKSG